MHCARRNLTELIYQLRTEADTPALQAFSIGIGILIGCLPVYGLHLAMCIVVAKLLGLSRLKMYLATNLNNPLVGPFLTLAEIQLGGLLRRGEPHALTVDAMRSLNLWSFGVDLALGAVVTGLVLGLVGGIATFGLLRRNVRDRYRRLLLEEASRPYLEQGVVTWELVRGKLRHDPVYLELITRPWLPAIGTLVDLGCGRGILLALLRTASQEQLRSIRPADCAEAPTLELYGIDGRVRAVETARRAGLPVTLGDLVTAEVPSCSCAVLLDVLHYLGPEQQDSLLRRIAEALEPGGWLLIRDADATPSPGFWWTATAERLCSIMRGQPLARFTYRTRDQWVTALTTLGFEVETVPMSRGTPFRNVLMRARRRC